MALLPDNKGIVPGSDLTTGSTPEAPPTNQTIPANTAVYVPYLFEIPAGVTVEIGSGAVLEIG